MRKIFLVVAIALIVSSCAKQTSEEKEQAQKPQIMLSASFSAPDTTIATSSIKSKATATSLTETKPQAATRATATAFEAGDQLGLFVVKAGQGVQHADNLVDNARMVVAADGVIKGDPTVVYYPESSVSLYSYYPHNQSGDATADALGVQVGIRTDQTDFSSVKLSDLCFGSLLNTDPSKSAKPISFSHKFSQLRVEVSTYAGCPAVKQVRLLGIKDSALLNIETGVVTLKNHTAEVLPNKRAENSYLAVIPAQTLTGACVAIDLADGKTFVFNAVSPINLTQSATNSLNLSINDKGVVSLKGDPSISPWTGVSDSGVVSSAVENEISLYWLSPHADYAAADKVTLTITDPLGVVREVDLAPMVDPKSSSEYAIYNLNLSLAGTTYPLTVNRVKVRKGDTLLRHCSEYMLLGKVFTKFGQHTLGMQPDKIKIGNLWWATGNLVADGPNNCVIGDPGDGGLYFQFGSLIGWKGGESGDGTGRAAKADGTYYVGSAFNAANEVQVYPSVFYKISNIGTTWPIQIGTNLYYFGYNAAPYSTGGTNIQNYPGFLSGALASDGVGDPCRYYLGSTWRLPTYIETKAMTDAATTKTWPGSWANTSTNSYLVFTFSGGTELKFPAVGYRHYSNGAIYTVGDIGYNWSSSVFNYNNGYMLSFNSGKYIKPQNATYRSIAMTIRCVSN